MSTPTLIQAQVYKRRLTFLAELIVSLNEIIDEMQELVNQLVEAREAGVIV